MKRLVLLAACGSRDPAPPPSPPTPAPATEVACEQLPFAASTPVPEASGAAWFTVADKRVLVVMGDSGQHGAYGLLDPGDGTTLEQGMLPLGDAGDDLEGLASRGDTLYGVTSAGWMRAWKRDGNGFALVDGPYPLGPVDLPNKTPHHGLGDVPPEGDGMVCGARGTNCGRNYEGLCLTATAGFVAAKADGHLYALTTENGRFVVHHDQAIAIGKPGVIADCAFDGDALYVGSNLFDANQVYRVTGWQDPAHATVDKLAAIGAGFSEALAVRGDLVYRLSDTGGSPSLMAKFRCAPAAR